MGELLDKVGGLDQVSRKKDRLLTPYHLDIHAWTKNLDGQPLPFRRAAREIHGLFSDPQHWRFEAFMKIGWHASGYDAYVAYVFQQQSAGTYVKSEVPPKSWISYRDFLDVEKAFANTPAIDSYPSRSDSYRKSPRKVGFEAARLPDFPYKQAEITDDQRSSRYALASLTAESFPLVRADRVYTPVDEDPSRIMFNLWLIDVVAPLEKELEALPGNLQSQRANLEAQQRTLESGLARINAELAALTDQAMTEQVATLSQRVAVLQRHPVLV